MRLRSLTLEEFRSYRRLELVIEPAGLRLAGANGSGKSSLLEAIAMLATTRSPRSTSDRDTIGWNSGEDFGVPPFARLGAVIERGDGEVRVEIALSTDPARPTAAKKQIKLNGRPVRAMDAVGALKAVLFSPEDVALVAGPPSGRRRYLDLTISQMDGTYLRALSRYNRLLTQRNSLLKSLSKERLDPSGSGAVAQLAYWDDELVAFGSLLTAFRFHLVGRLATMAAERFRWLSGGALEIAYLPSVGGPSPAWGGGRTRSDLQAVVARDFADALANQRREELRRGVSVLGPHRDDLSIAVGGVDMATFGSRGQQRLAVVALKLGEADLMVAEAGEAPVLLLDDVLSELDEEHRSLLLRALPELGAQVLVTATDDRFLDDPVLAELPMARVESGSVVTPS